MTQTKDDLRSDESALLAALRDAGADVGRPKSMKCPWHDDRSPSAGVYEKDGVWRFKCQAAGCGLNLDVFDVLARNSGRNVEDVLRDYQRDETDKPLRRGSDVKPVVVTADPPAEYESIAAFRAAFTGSVRLYKYTDPATNNVDLIKLRIERTGQKKRFVQGHLATPGADGRVIAAAPPKPWPLFNRIRLAAAEEVFFVEGEKCVEAMTRANFVATCVSGGGGRDSQKNTDLTPLAGKRVYFWPDNDPPDANGERCGHRHMRAVIAECQELGIRIDPYWIDPEALAIGEKGDVVDYLARFEDAAAHPDAIDMAKEMAEPLGRAARFRRYNEDAIEGKRQAIPFPGCPKLAHLTKAIQPGTTTVLCGEGGSTKSMLVMQLCTGWTLQGVAVAVYMLEDDVNLHVNRALAQLAGEQGMTDPDWLKQNGDRARQIMATHAVTTESLLEAMDDAPEQALAYPDIIHWIKRRCEAGARILVIDPITAIDGGKESWRSDLDFIVQAKSIARRHGASLILVTHPRGNIKGDNPKLDDMAGGRGFPRFAQTVMWIKYHDHRRRIESSYGMTTTEQVDRTIYLLKVRNGRGERTRVAFKFDKASLRFTELGIDLGKPREDEPHADDEQHEGGIP